VRSKAGNVDTGPVTLGDLTEACHTVNNNRRSCDPKESIANMYLLSNTY